MRPLSDDAPGEMVSMGRRSYYVPEPLPPADDGLSQSHRERAADILAVSDTGLEPTYLDEPADAPENVIREAVASAAIENHETSPDMVRHALENPDKRYDTDTQAAVNIVTALVEVDRWLSNSTGSASLMWTPERWHGLHKHIMRNVAEDHITIGAFRDVPVRVADFIPPSPAKVPDLSNTLIKYMNTRNDRANQSQPVIDAGFVHVQFETIHPYADGNGRLGRVLGVAALADWMNASVNQVAGFSHELAQRRDTYFERLNGVNYDNEWAEWTDLWLDAVEAAVD